jgi:hypothetical protein
MMKKFRQFTAAAVSLGAVFLLEACQTTSSVSGNAHELAIGKFAKSNTPVNIAENPPVNLNNKLKTDIFDMRSEMVNKHAQLLQGTYQPNFEIFGMVTSGKPWWGLYGSQLFGPGERAIEGPSKESLYLLNPFRLVSAEPASGGIWNLRKLKASDYPSLPYYWKPGAVKFDAKNSIAEVTYDVSGYKKELERFKYGLNGPVLVTRFALIAYNARDLGFHYLSVSPQNSTNIANFARNDQPVELRQFIHCGGSCGYPGGCNNMSPFIPELESLNLNGLPARAYILLWEEKPTSVKQVPDMVFVLNFV